MIAVSRVIVNHNGKGGSALEPHFWDQESRDKQRMVRMRVNVDPGPSWFLEWALDSG